MILCLLASTVSTDASQQPSAADDRLVHAFDFDELDNPRPIPRHWLRLDGPGYPAWNQEQLGFVPVNPSDPQSTDFAFSLGTRGGSAGIRLMPGVLAAIPHTEYLVTCKIRTVDIRRARAFISAAFTDESNEVIPETLTTTRPMISNNAWQEVSFRVRSKVPHATWLVLELRLDQPEQFHSKAARSEEPALADISGSVEFNDLSIWRIPRTDLSLAAGNFVIAPAQPTITAFFQDILRSDLLVHVRVIDADDLVVDETTASFGPTRRRLTWTPRIDRFGWYRVELSVGNGSDDLESVATGSISLPTSVLPAAAVEFAYLPDRQSHLRSGPGNSSLERDGLGIMADGMAAADLNVSLVPTRILGPDHVTLPAWLGSTTRDRVGRERDVLLENFAPLTSSGTRVHLALAQLPADSLPEGASASARADVLAGFRSRPDALWPYLSEYLASFSPGVRKWQLGSSRWESASTQRPLLTAVAEALARIRRGSRQTCIVLPWQADDALPLSQNRGSVSASGGDMLTDGSVRFLIAVPDEFPPDAMSELFARVRRSGHEADYLIRTLDPDVYGRRESAHDLIRRATIAWHAGVESLAIDAPWFVRSPDAFDESMREDPADDDDSDDELTPQPTFIFSAWRTFVTTLSRAEPAGMLELSPGISARVFRRSDDSGVMVLWSESPELDELTVSLFLGHDAVSVMDIDGNLRPVPLGDDGMHRLTIARDPIYVLGADINLALFRAGFSITPSMIEASSDRHRHEIVLSNPWPNAVTGSLRIAEPKRWRINDRTQRFEIPAGGMIHLPFEFTLPAYEYAGQTPVVVHVDLDTGQTLSTDLTTTMAIGLLGVTFNADYTIESVGASGGGDIVVTLHIANSSDRPARLRSVAIAPMNQPMQALLGSLSPGQSTRRVFRFPAAADRLRGESIRVGIKNADGDGQLNLLLPIR